MGLSGIAPRGVSAKSVGPSQNTAPANGGLSCFLDAQLRMSKGLPQWDRCAAAWKWRARPKNPPSWRRAMTRIDGEHTGEHVLRGCHRGPRLKLAGRERP